MHLCEPNNCALCLCFDEPSNCTCIGIHFIMPTQFLIVEYCINAKKIYHSHVVFIEIVTNICSMPMSCIISMHVWELSCYPCSKLSPILVWLRHQNCSCLSCHTLPLLLTIHSESKLLWLLTSQVLGLHWSEKSKIATP